MYNEEWGEIYFQLTELKSKRFIRYPNIEKSRGEKKVAYDWSFVFSGLSFLLWIGMPSDGISFWFYILRITVTLGAVSFIWSFIMLKRRIRNYETLTSQIYELEKKLENTPQKLN